MWLLKLKHIRALSLIAVVGLAGCGFQPLYGNQSRGASEAQNVSDMASIAISPIPNRAGQLLRNDLLDRLTPKGRRGKSEYRLDVNLAENRSDLVILKDATSTFAKMELTARFVLVDLKTSEQVLRGVSKSVTSFNIVDSQYANLSAEKGARKRAVEEISDDMRIRIGIYFKNRG